MKTQQQETPKKPIDELQAMRRVVQTLERQPLASRRRIVAYLTSLFNPPLEPSPVSGLDDGD